jgi:drug/metabolite transporter (DMT)-like permease
MSVQIPIQKSRLGIAILFIIIACLCYTAMAICVKMALPTSPIPIIVFIRFLSLFILMLPFIAASGGRVLQANRPWLLIGRGVIGVLGISLFYFALDNIPLAIAILLSSTEPIFIPFVFRFARGTKILPKLYYGIIVGLVGVALILHPTAGYFQLATLLALGAGLCRAFSISMVRIATKSDDITTIMFYFFAVGLVVSGFYSIMSWHHPAEFAWWWMIGSGVASFLFQFAITKSLSFAPARIMGPFNYLAVVFAAMADWVFWGIGISWYVGVGIILVILGAVLTAVLGREIL